jgi:hypothetical protein
VNTPARLADQTWRFRSLGGECHLLVDSGPRHIVLTATMRKGSRLPVLATRGKEGWLEELTPDHPVARRIEVCLEAAQGISLPTEYMQAVEGLRTAAMALAREWIPHTSTCINGRIDDLGRALVLLDAFTEAGRERLRNAVKQGAQQEVLSQ